MSGQHAANMTFWGPGANQNKQKHMDFDADGSSMGHGRVLFLFFLDTLPKKIGSSLGII
jgi:hypothetical protein